jgi:hypothetical protein
MRSSKDINDHTGLVISAARCRMAELFWPMVACPVECEAYSSGVSPSAKKEISLCALCASVVNLRPDS